MAMSLRTRVVLALIGVLLIALAGVALAYSLSPTLMAREQALPAPTLFVPPPEARELP